MVLVYVKQQVGEVENGRGATALRCLLTTIMIITG